MRGAYVPCAIALVLTAFCLAWFWIRNLESTFDIEHHTDMGALFSYDPLDSSTREKSGIYSRAMSRGGSRSPFASRQNTTLSPRPTYRARSSIDQTFGDRDITDSPLAAARMSRDTSGHSMPALDEEKMDDDTLLGEPALSLEQADSEASGPSFNSPLYIVGHPHQLKLERLPCFAMLHAPTACVPLDGTCLTHTGPKELPRSCKRSFTDGQLCRCVRLFRRFLTHTASLLLHDSPRRRLSACRRGRSLAHPQVSHLSRFLHDDLPARLQRSS